HQYVESAGGIDRDGISAAGRELRLRSGFGRRRKVSRRARAAPRGAAGRAYDDVLGAGRALREPAMGPVRRRQRRYRQVRQAFGRQGSAAADQAGEPSGDGGRGRAGRNAGRRRLRRAVRARGGRDRERFRLGQVFARLHQEELRRGAGAMSYDAIVVGAGISGAATAYHLRKAGSKTLLIERGEPASGGTGKSAAIIRQSYSTPLLVRLARASITMFENAKAELGRDAGFVQDGYCFVVSQEMLDGAKKNVAMQKGLGIVNEWSEGPGFPQHLPEINPDGIAGIVYEPHGGYADPVQATEAYVAAFQAAGGEFRPRTPARALVRKGDRITGVALDGGEIAAAHVVNAAGPWAKPLAASAGLDLPMRSVREQDTVWQVPAGRAMPKTSISMGVDATYYRPLGQGRFIIGRGFPKQYVDVDPYNYKTTADGDFISDVQTRFERRFPSFAWMKLIEAYA